MWFRKKAVPAQCVCHHLDPRNEAPVTVVRAIGDGRGEVPREMYERFNDNGQMYLVFMAGKDNPAKMEGWFAPKANAMETYALWYDESNPLSRGLRMAALPVVPGEKDQAIDDFMKAWIFFNEKIKWKPGVSLAQVISSFSVPIHSRWENQYFNLQAWGDWLFWSVIEEAIVREGKFKPDEIRTAVAEAQAIKRPW
jgi:hypothetical protein